MTNRIGTSSGSLSEPTGGVTDELGNQLLSTDTTGGEAQTLGPQLSREIIAGIPNADFSILPENPSEQLSDANDLPFFTFADNFGWDINYIAATNVNAAIIDSTVGTPSGFELQFTAPAGSNEFESLALERWLAVPASYAYSYTAWPVIHAYCELPGDDADYFNLIIQAQYYANDQTTVLNSSTVIYPASSLAGMLPDGRLGREINLFYDSIGGVNVVPASAAWVKIRLGVVVNGVATTTDTEQINVTGIRIARAQTGPLAVLDTLPTPENDSAGYLDYEGSVVSVNNARGTDLFFDPKIGRLQILPGPTTPNDNLSWHWVNTAPDGAQYSGSNTNCTSGTATTLDLSTKIQGVVVMPNPSGDEVRPPPGLYQIVARVSFESDGGGTYRRVFVHKHGTSIGNSSFGVNGGALAYSTFVTCFEALDGFDDISVVAQHNAGSTIYATVVELTFIRLGATW